MIPKSTDKTLVGDREQLKQAFGRTAILSNEKYRGVRLKLSQDVLEITANNPEQEQAGEIVGVEYSGGHLDIGFNVSYLLDVLGVINESTVRMSLSDESSSALIERGDNPTADGDPENLYVVMPMRL